MDRGGPPEILLTLTLPREESSLPLVRHLCKHALCELGVSDDCVHDVELALTEACANVVEHARNGAYEVRIDIGPDACEIRVVDKGEGFDVDGLARLESDLQAEGGRGLPLMKALVDRIDFVSAPDTGTVVHLVKDLRSAI